MSAPPRDELARLRARIEELERGLLHAGPVLQALGEDIPDNIMLLDRESRVQYVNWTVPGLSREQVIGTPVFLFAAEEYHESIRRCHRRVLETGEPDRFASEYRGPEGVSYWESRVRPIEREGEIIGLAQVSTNVSAQRAAAAAARDRLFEMSPDLMAVCTRDGRLVRVNPAFERALGFPSDELLGRTPAAFTHRDDRDAMRTALRQIAGDVELDDFESRCVRKDGTELWLSWSIRPDPDADRLHCVARDVSEQKRLEQELRQAQKMEAIGQLAGGLAHDFNNILLVIRANLDLAGLGGVQNERIRAARDAVGRAADLTRQLLTLARRERAQLGSVDLNELTRNLLAMLSRLIPESIVVTTRLDPSLEPVHADPGQLEQVLVNFCVNARDAMQGGGRMSIVTARDSLSAADCKGHPLLEPGPCARLSVSDTGEGMAQEVCERVFEPFFTTKGPRGGTGLGLSTVYGIIEQHRGLVKATSEPGSGSTFSIWLPFAPGTIRRHAPPAVHGEGTILLVEDDAQVRAVVLAILERSGFEVLAAGDGRAGLALFEDHRERVSMLVLDIVMPHLSGPALRQKIEQLRPGLPFVFISGYSDQATLTAAAIDPATVLTKPFSSDALVARVRHAIAAPAAKKVPGP